MDEEKPTDNMMAEQAFHPPARTHESDDQLVAALAAHEPAAWRNLFEEQYDRVYRYAYLRTGNAADADDAASATFTEAVRGIGRYQHRGTPVAAWLFRIAHNETVDLLKRRSRRLTATLDHPDAAVIAAPDDIAAADNRREVAEALGALKHAHRDVLMLRLVEGHSVADTARILGKTEGAIKVTQMRALQTVRKALKIDRKIRDTHTGDTP